MRGNLEYDVGNIVADLDRKVKHKKFRVQALAIIVASEINCRKVKTENKFAKKMLSILID